MRIALIAGLAILLTNWISAETNYEKKFEALYRNTTRLTLEELKTNSVHLYFIMTTNSQINPTSFTYPEFEVVIYNNMSNFVSNVQDKLTARYDYGKYGFDEVSFKLTPTLIIKYTNSLSNADSIIPSLVPTWNLFMGSAITYYKGDVKSYSTIGWRYFEPMPNVSLEISGGYEISNKVFDIIPSATYKLFDKIEVGIAISLFNFGYGITYGVVL